jgi:integrase
LEKLINDRKVIRIITPEEFKKLFVGDWQKVWEDDRLVYTANVLAAVTGMRANEIIGLKGCYVYDDHIYLCMQFNQYGYRPTKTKDEHSIPVPSAVIDALKELKKINGDGFLFSNDGGAKPIDRHTVYRKFHKALTNIGISEAEIAERKLHLHAWWHFFNTEMLKAGLTVTPGAGDNRA